MRLVVSVICPIRTKERFDNHDATTTATAVNTNKMTTDHNRRPESTSWETTVVCSTSSCLPSLPTVTWLMPSLSALPVISVHSASAGGLPPAMTVTPSSSTHLMSPSIAVLNSPWTRKYWTTRSAVPPATNTAAISAVRRVRKLHRRFTVPVTWLL